MNNAEDGAEALKTNEQIEPEIVDEEVSEELDQGTQSIDKNDEDESKDEPSETKKGKPGKTSLYSLEKERKAKKEALEKVARLERELEANKQTSKLAEIAGLTKTKEAEAEALKAPIHYDYDDDESYQAAMSEYSDKLLDQAQQRAQKTLKETLADEREQLAQSQAKAEADRVYEEKRAEYLDRAGKLNAPDFLASERKLYNPDVPADHPDAGVWSKEFFEYAVANVENSERMILELSNDPQKALNMALDVEKNFFGGIKAFVDYAAQLGQIETGGDLPPPDERLDGGVGGVGSSYDKELNALRDKKKKGLIDQNKLIKLKKELKKKYAA